MTYRELAALRTENARASRAVMRLMGIVEWNEHRLASALQALQILRKAVVEAYARPADSLLLAITIADLTLKPERDYMTAWAALSATTNSRRSPAPGAETGPAGAQGGALDSGSAPAAAVGGSLPSDDRSASPSHGAARGDQARPAGGTALATTTIDDRNLRQSGGPGHSASQSQEPPVRRFISPRGEDHGS